MFSDPWDYDWLPAIHSNKGFFYLVPVSAQRRACTLPGRRPKRSSHCGKWHVFHICTNIGQIHQFDLHLRNMGPISLPNIAPLTHLGGTSAQVEVHMASKWRTWPAQYEILQTSIISGISNVFWHRWSFASNNGSHVVSTLGPICCEVAAKGLQVAPCWTWVGLHVHSMASSSDPFYNVFRLRWGFVLGHVSHVGPALGPTCTTLPLRRTQLRHVRPDLCQTPKLRHVGPKLGRSWGASGSSSAQVRRKLGSSRFARPNLRPRTTKFDPSRLRLGQVGPCSSPPHPQLVVPYSSALKSRLWPARSLSYNQGPRITRIH